MSVAGERPQGLSPALALYYQQCVHYTRCYAGAVFCRESGCCLDATRLVIQDGCL
jgi:hypothetical protein